MRAFSLTLTVVALLACTSHDVATSSSPVVGGFFDESAGPTVAIFKCNGACAFTPYLNVEEICSGTLIAPNLVLTARHCVAPQIDADLGVLCSKSTFGTPLPADNFIATPAKDVNEGGPWFVAAEVDVSGQDGDLVCGNDLAVLHLRSSYVGAAPLVPRILSAPMKGEKYDAVGYGDDLDGGIGYRHQRDGLVVECVASQCVTVGPDLAPITAASEWGGQTGLCGGDSGGPAIDAMGLIIGVTSRADATNCTSPIYSRVDSHAAWLQSQAAQAAAEGDYEIPSWAFATLPSITDAAPPPDASPPTFTFDAGGTGALTPQSAQGGCNTSNGAPDSGVLLLFIAAWNVLKRRR